MAENESDSSCPFDETEIPVHSQKIDTIENNHSDLSDNEEEFAENLKTYKTLYSSKNIEEKAKNAQNNQENEPDKPKKTLKQHFRDLHQKVKIFEPLRGNSLPISNLYPDYDLVIECSDYVRLAVHGEVLFNVSRTVRNMMIKMNPSVKVKKIDILVIMRMKFLVQNNLFYREIFEKF